MFSFLLNKLLYGFLVLFGVIAVVFFLFNLAPGDPVRNLLGENASEQIVQDMRRKFDLDLPVGKRFLIYLNDLSPLSVHSTEPTSRVFLGEDKYQYAGSVELSGKKLLVLKWPYLKRSFYSERSVADVLAEAIPGTLVLACVSMGLAMLLGLAMGILAALRKDSFYDRAMLFISAIGMAGPSFFVAIIVAWFGAIVWREETRLPLFPIMILVVYVLARFLFRKSDNRKKLITLLNYGSAVMVIAWLTCEIFWRGLPVITSRIQLPGTGLNMTGSLYSVDVWKGEYLDLRNMILPVITLMIRPLAVVVQLTRSSLLDVLSQDFIRTARAKGLSERRVVLVHALRNALNPVITAASGWFASLLAGAVFVEFVFGWKGLGQEMFTAIEKQDLPVVMGGVIIIAAAFVIINLLVDLLYGWIDPRIRIS